MFVLEPAPSITVDVTIRQPGKAGPDTLDATWKLYPWDDRVERVRRINAGEITDEQLVEEDLVELSEVQDSHGQAYSIEQLMQVAYVRRPLIASWFAAQDGRAKAAAKN